MCEELPSLGEHEQKALTELEDQLTEHRILTLISFNTGLRALNTLPERPIANVSQAKEVAVALLIRLLKDIRCASSLGARRYALESCSVTASMLASAYSLAFIGADDVLAQEWVDHEDPTTNFRRVCTLVQKVVGGTSVSVAGETVERQFRVYRQLCMAKHFSPLLQMGHGYTYREGGVVAEVGPQTIEAATRVMWFAVELGGGVTELHLVEYICLSVTGSGQPAPRIRLHGLRVKTGQLHQTGLQQWGDEGPLQGKW